MLHGLTGSGNVFHAGYWILTAGSASLGIEIGAAI